MPVHRAPTGDDPERVQARSGDPPTDEKAGRAPAPGEDSSSGGFTVRSVDVSVPRTGEIPVAAPQPVATEAPPPDPMVGRTLAGRFRIQSPLGRGGMGQVYKAEQLPLGRPVALKVMVPHFAAAPDTEYEQRFFLEAAVASKITHPNVITVFDYGKDADTFFIAMEFLHGRTLSRALADDGAFPLERVIHIATQAARGAREAHRQGAIHRDLKPANIMLIDHNEDVDFVKILDFGLVKVARVEGGKELTLTGMFLGSPKYMSPEQIRNQAPDARSDIYSLGIILFQMLTGRVPFTDEVPVNIMLRHLNDAIPVPSAAAPDRAIPPCLDEVVRRCTQKEREDRYASMDELLAALKAARHEVTGSSSASNSQVGPNASVSAVLASVPPATAAAPPVPVATAAPPPAAQVAPVPPERRSLLVPIGVSAVAAVASVALLAWLTEPQAPPRAPTPAPAPVVAPPPAPVVVAPPAARPLMITTQPAGATARLGERVLGTTPLLAELPASSGDRVVVELTREGHDRTLLELVVTEGRFKGHAVLSPTRAAPAPPPATTTKKPRKKKAASDFKDDPY